MALKKYHKTAQLYNKNGTDTSNGFVNRAYLNSIGEVGDSGNHTISEYIDISAFEQITISGMGATTASITDVFYNANHEKVSYFVVDVVPKTVNVPSNAKYIRVTVANSRKDTLMLNGGSTALDYEAYGIVPIDWFYRRYETATDAATTLPVEIFTDGQPVSSYTIKGNTTTSGTPSPQNPITISGVGNKTANLWNVTGATSGYLTDGGAITPSDYYYTTDYIVVKADTNYRYSLTSNFGGNRLFRVSYYDTSKTFISNSTSSAFGDGAWSVVWTTPANAKYIRIAYINPADTTKSDTYKMMSEGSTALPYEPYGMYKISISSNGVALSPMYFSQQLMDINGTVDNYVSTGTATYNINKKVFDGSEDWQIEMTDNFYMNTPLSGNTGRATVLCTHQVSTSSSYITGENCFISPSGRFNFTTSAVTHTVNDFKTWLQQQYANGTPVTVYYVLATPTTETVTAPSIPTTGGEVSIDVDTTVKPSEFDLTYHGWHEHQPKKKSANLWNEEYPDLSETAIYVPLNVGEGNFTLSTNFQAVNNVTDIFLLSGNVTSGINSSVNGAYAGKNITTASIDGYVTVAYRQYAQPYTGALPYCEVMLNEGSTALPYVPYWE